MVGKRRRADDSHAPLSRQLHDKRADGTGGTGHVQGLVRLHSEGVHAFHGRIVGYRDGRRGREVELVRNRRDTALIDDHRLGPRAAFRVHHGGRHDPVTHRDAVHRRAHSGDDTGGLQTNDVGDGHLRRDEVPVVDADAERMDLEGDLVSVGRWHLDVGELDPLVDRIDPHISLHDHMSVSHAFRFARIYLLTTLLAAILGNMTTTGGRSALTYEEEAAWLALLFSHATVMARVEAALADRHGISFSTCEILCGWPVSPTSVRTLAGELVSVSPSRASRVIQELVNEGHLRRQAVQNDGRISLISLTPSGRRYTAAVQKTFAAVAYEHFVAPSTRPTSPTCGASGTSSASLSSRGTVLALPTSPSTHECPGAVVTRALVLGANGQIGRAIAAELAQAGLALMVAARNAEGLKALTADLRASGARSMRSRSTFATPPRWRSWWIVRTGCPWRSTTSAWLNRSRRSTAWTSMTSTRCWP